MRYDFVLFAKVLPFFDFDWRNNSNYNTTNSHQQVDRNTLNMETGKTKVTEIQQFVSCLHC